MKVVQGIFAIALTISEILTFEIFNHQKVGKRHLVQFFAMTNEKICKKLPTHFCASSYHFSDIKLKFDL